MLKKVIRKLKTLFVKKNMIIVKIDGGICSQMVQYAFGQLFIDKKDYKNKDVIIKYDLTWFSENGWDLLHKDKRNYDLDKLFPYLKINKASKLEIETYKKLYNTDVTDFEKLFNMEVPFCLENYYDFPSKNFVDSFNKLFNFDKFECNDDNKKLLALIKDFPISCGIHVRRGDLANNEIAKKCGYKNGICNSNYFKKAINIINEKFNNVKFFFFSDDIDYVKNELIPLIGSINYNIVNINTAENGYLDLFLLSNCTHQIASVGSLGTTAYFLNKNQGKVLLTNKNYYYEIADKAILLDNEGNILNKKNI